MSKIVVGDSIKITFTDGSVALCKILHRPEWDLISVFWQLEDANTKKVFYQNMRSERLDKIEKLK